MLCQNRNNINYCNATGKAEWIKLAVKPTDTVIRIKSQNATCTRTLTGETSSEIRERKSYIK